MLSYQRVRYAGSNWGELLTRLSSSSNETSTANQSLVVLSSMSVGFRISKSFAAAAGAEILSARSKGKKDDGDDQTQQSVGEDFLTRIFPGSNIVRLFADSIKKTEQLSKPLVNYQICPDVGVFYSAWKSKKRRFDSDKLAQKAADIILTQFKSEEDNFDGKDCVNDFLSISHVDSGEKSTRINEMEKEKK